MADLARRAGVAVDSIAIIESGERNTLLSTVLAVAKGLGVEPYELFEGEFSSPSLDIARLFDRLDSAQRVAFLNLARALTKAPASAPAM